MTVDLAPPAPTEPEPQLDEKEEIAVLETERPYDLLITPIVFLLLLALTVVVWVYSDFDRTTADILEPDKLIRQTQQQIGIVFWSTILVILIAIPAGILITRPGFKRLATPILTVANSGQAVPAYGLIVLFFAWLGLGSGLPIGGTTTAVAALTLYGILPVLRNTMVGLEQVNPAVIEAGRGMGMSKMQALLRIELPLSVSVILAGVRTALVINVGTATLVFLIGAGGLGETINSGLKLQRNTAIFVGAALVAMLALLIDWSAALAERNLRPKGL
jgi:osmoprotectant transport system permease protein